MNVSTIIVFSQLLADMFLVYKWRYVILYTTLILRRVILS